MMNITLLICLAFSIVIPLIVVIKPLFRDDQQDYFITGTIAREFDESLSILEAISELETDFKMGKISKRDYETISIEYQHRYLVSKDQKA